MAKIKRKRIRHKEEEKQCVMSEKTLRTWPVMKLVCELLYERRNTALVRNALLSVLKGRRLDEVLTYTGGGSKATPAVDDDDDDDYDADDEFNAYVISVIDDFNDNKATANTLANALLDSGWDFSDPAGQMEKKAKTVNRILISWSRGPETHVYAESLTDRQRGLLKMFGDAYLRSVGED